MLEVEFSSDFQFAELSEYVNMFSFFLCTQLSKTVHDLGAKKCSLKTNKQETKLGLIYSISLV